MPARSHEWMVPIVIAVAVGVCISVFSCLGKQARGTEPDRTKYEVPAWIDDEWVRSVMTDSLTYWYGSQTHPRVYQEDGQLFRINESPATFDPTGSPNNEKPWFHTGGTDEMADKRTKLFFWLPPGEKVKIRRVRIRTGQYSARKYRQDFPIGAIVGEKLSDGNDFFELRVRRKEDNQVDKTGEFRADNWVGYQYERPDFVKPVGYVAVENCQDCHKDGGQHAKEINSARDWWGIIGTEPGGPLHLHFFRHWDVKNRRRLTFNKDLERFFTIRKKAG